MRTLPERSVAAALQLAWLVALFCPACEPGPAKITGNTARVVGERVTLVLVEGEEPFSASARLRVSEKETYDSKELRVERLESGRKLALSIPTGITAGPAVIHVRKEGSPEEYEIPLTIDRLATFVTDTGELHLVPLPPATAAVQSQKVGSDDGTVLLSLSDDATTVVTASADQLALFRVSADIAQGRVTGKAPAVVQALAALANGAVVATAGVEPADSVVRLYQVHTDDGLKESDSRLVKDTTVKALAVFDRGSQRPKVSLLTDCKDGGDCVVVVDFAVPANEGDLTAQALDETSSANTIAISADGRVVAVPDNDVIHGVDYAGTEPVLSSLAWGIDGAANPVGIARTQTPVVGNPGLQDVFAAAESARGAVQLFGAPGGMLLSLTQQPQALKTPPLAVSFGRHREIYVLTADRKLLSMAAGGDQFRPVNLAVPKQAIDLAVQR